MGTHNEMIVENNMECKMLMFVVCQLFLSNRSEDRCGRCVSRCESCGTRLQHIEEKMTWYESSIEFLTEMCGCFLVCNQSISKCGCFPFQFGLV